MGKRRLSPAIVKGLAVKLLFPVVMHPKPIDASGEVLAGLPCSRVFFVAFWKQFVDIEKHSETDSIF